MVDILEAQQTAVTWTSSGGDETLTLTSLGNNAGRAGDVHDFGASHAPWLYVELTVDFNAAPTAGLPVHVFWSWSANGTTFQGECTGSDAAFSTLADLQRLDHVGSLLASNDTDPQRAGWYIKMKQRYGLPVVYNESGQALTATGTDQIVKAVPCNLNSA